MNRLLLMITLCISLTTAMADSPAMKQLLDEYRTIGTADMDFNRGQSLWQQTVTVNGKPHSCTNCHGTNLNNEGKHHTTGKVIQAMSPTVNPQRLTDRAKIETWFKRNCKWTWGRECTAQEKSDLLIYIDQYANPI